MEFKHERVMDRQGPPGSSSSAPIAAYSSSRRRYPIPPTDRTSVPETRKTVGGEVGDPGLPWLR